MAPFIWDTFYIGRWSDDAIDKSRPPWRVEGVTGPRYEEALGLEPKVELSAHQVPMSVTQCVYNMPISIEDKLRR